MTVTGDTSWPPARRPGDRRPPDAGGRQRSGSPGGWEQNAAGGPAGRQAGQHDGRPWSGGGGQVRAGALPPSSWPAGDRQTAPGRQPAVAGPGGVVYGPPVAAGLGIRPDLVGPEAVRSAAGGEVTSRASRAAARRRARRRRWMEWPILIVLSLVAAVLVRTFVLQTFFIPSPSMHPTLVEDDRVLVNKLSYRLHDVHRGDVVVFRRPPNLHVDDEDLIKRVIGLPGDTVEARGGKVYVNGRLLQEPYLAPECHGTEDFLRVAVPSDHVFVMGDNRCDSTDSRAFGPISTDLVVGRAFVRMWPLNRLGWL